MIPKIIHYCWFGGGNLSEMARNCILSWKKYCPEYEIKLWNEENFDFNCCEYVKEAYQAKKWAFVSDYARFYILYTYGGIYFDTDVEIVKNIDEIIKTGPFMGCELDAHNNKGYGIRVNPGLGMAAEPKMELYRIILDRYRERHFIGINGEQDMTTVVEFVTRILLEKGLKEEQEIQNVDDIIIYPKEYFNPYDFDTGKINPSDKTVSIHHFAASWTSKRNKINTRIYQFINRLKGK